MKDSAMRAAILDCLAGHLQPLLAADVAQLMRLPPSRWAVFYGNLEDLVQADLVTWTVLPLEGTGASYYAITPAGRAAQEAAA